MISTIAKTASAAMLAVTLGAAVPAFAASHAESVAMVTEGMSMLDMDTSMVEGLTEEQVLEIQNVLDSTDDDETKKARINEITGM